MILFVDDECSRVENDADELRYCGYEVELVGTIDEALKFLEVRSDEVDGVICDVMMPHGSRFSAEETRDGLRTGVKLFEWARQRWPELPFVVFTNVSRDEALRQRLDREPACIYIEKRDCLGVAFTERVLKLIPVRHEGGPLA